MKKKIVVIANFTRLPNENGNSRFPYIINMLDKEKYDIELITSTFSHEDKKHRIRDLKKYDYRIKLIEEPGYPKNVCIKRFYSHYVFAKNVEKYLNKMINKPDVIYCAIPSLDLAKVVAKYAKKNNAKFIIDVQDLWPEAFKMVLNLPPITSVIYGMMTKSANYAYSQADAIIAVSDTYLERASSVNTKAEDKASVFLGTDLRYFDNCSKDNFVEYTDGKIRLAYVGTLGHSYDLKVVIDSLVILKKKGIKNIELFAMGDGPLLQDFKDYAEAKKVDCEFVGRLEYTKMTGKLLACDIAINPIRKGAAQSIINKVGDYAAAGLPVINTQENGEYRELVEKYNIGFNCKCNDAKELAEKIELLYNDKNLRKQLGKNNRILAEEKFDRRRTYQRIIEIIEKG